MLTVEAESTAWATQLRMLGGELLNKIASEVGHNVVTKLNIQARRRRRGSAGRAGFRAGARATRTADRNGE